MRELDTKLRIEDILISNNIAEELSDDDLTTIGMSVYDGFMEDETSRIDWKDKQDEWMELALQVMEEKTFPWPGAANVKYPLLTTAAIQFASRAYPALIPGNDVVKGRVIGRDPQGIKQDRARRIGKHMSYQLLEQMPDWEEEMDKLCISLPILGTIFKKTYYDPSYERNVSELVYPKELVVNYWAKDLETAQRKTHILYMSKNDILERQRAGLWLDIEIDKLELQSESEDKSSDEIHGVKPPSSNDSSNPYCFLEQHTYLDLDGDDYAEPYIVTIDSKTKQVHKITRRFELDDIKYAGQDIQCIKPEEYFTKFGFVPNPDGSFYDVGFGLLLGPINEVINTLLNQLIDSGTMSNLQAGFIARGIRIKGGTKNFEPGEWKTVNATGDDLRKGIFALPTREPSNVLFTLLSLMIESGEKLASVTDMLLGENPGQNQPATTSMAVLEQGLKVFTSIYKRLYRALKKEYYKIFILNSRYLENEDYFMVLDAGEEKQEKVGVEDYNPEDLDVRPAADPNVATETKRLMKIQALGELLQLGTINPQVFTKRALEAQGQEGIEELMTLPPPQPNPEIVLEQEKFKDESQRGWAQIFNDQKKLENDTMKSESQSILNMVKAEAEKVNQSLEKYRIDVERMKASIQKYDKKTGSI